MTTTMLLHWPMHLVPLFALLFEGDVSSSLGVGSVVGPVTVVDSVVGAADVSLPKVAVVGIDALGGALTGMTDGALEAKVVFAFLLEGEVSSSLGVGRVVGSVTVVESVIGGADVSLPNVAVVRMDVLALAGMTDGALEATVV